MDLSMDQIACDELEVGPAMAMEHVDVEEELINKSSEVIDQVNQEDQESLEDISDIVEPHEELQQLDIGDIGVEFIIPDMMASENCTDKDLSEKQVEDNDVDKPQSPPGTSCLICYARCEPSIPNKNNLQKKQQQQSSSYRRSTSPLKECPILGELIDSEEEDLDDQMGVMFVIRKLMQLPKSMCEELLSSYGSPSEWGAAYCSFCTNTVEEAQEIAEKIANYRMKFKCLQERVKDEIMISAQELVPTAGTETPPVIEDIRRRFIQSKKHLVVLIGF